LKKQGKIRAAGVSTHENMALVINEVTKQGFFDVVLTAIFPVFVLLDSLVSAVCICFKVDKLNQKFSPLD